MELRQTVNALAKRVEIFKEYLKGYDELDAKAIASEFWSDFFNARKNFPDVSELVNFLNPSFSYSKGIGVHVNLNSDEQLYRFNKVSKCIEMYTSSDYIERLDIPTFGNPTLFKYKDSFTFASFLMNSGTSYTVIEEFKKWGSVDSKLSVCEIGPGWGGVCSQLLQGIDCHKYLLVDLPKNLYLSSSYLYGVSGREISFVQKTDESLSEGLNFAFPNCINSVTEKFDLILNSFSLQEMSMENVNGYFSWIQERLSDEGIFFFINSHAKSGVRKPSDYPLDNFEVVKIKTFRVAPMGLFNTIPYLVIYKKRQGHKLNYNNFDVLGYLTQLGLCENIRFLQEAFANSNTEESDIFKQLYKFFQANTIDEKSVALEGKCFSEETLVLQHYLKGLCLFVDGNISEGKAHLLKAKSLGLTGFALVLAHILICSDKKKMSKKVLLSVSDELVVSIDKNASHLKEEILNNKCIDELVVNLKERLLFSL